MDITDSLHWRDLIFSSQHMGHLNSMRLELFPHILSPSNGQMYDLKYSTGKTLLHFY
jgi:hypothetical protein